MVFGTLFVAPAFPANGALGLNNFEIGSPPEVNLAASATPSADIVNPNGGTDWTSLPLVSGSFDPGEVKVINDQNFTGTATVYSNPETAADDFCTTGNDLITKNGTKINDYPFQTVSGSPSPGKNDICQVYVSYVIEGGAVILYMGVVRRETGGTTAVALELNKVTQANRAVDDLLVTFEFDGSGPVSALTVRSWDGSQWVVESISNNNWDGTSWEHFGEVAVNLSDTQLLPPPTAVDDCSSFSSILPYGFAGNSANSNVGDWGGEVPVDIPRCGEIRITKEATPAADSSYVFEWELTDNEGVLSSASDTIVDGETDTVDVVAGEYTLAEIVEASPYELDRIECTDGQNPVDADEIAVAVGDTVSCTIYNEASTVQVVKTGSGDTDAEFDFSATGQSDFTLTIGDTSDAFVYAPGSTVTVGETLPGGLPAWDLTGIACLDDDDDPAPNLDVDVEDGTATFDTVAGETITCTFTNSQDALLTLEKDVVNDNGGTAADTDWMLAFSGSGGSDSGIEGSADVTNVNLPVGSYDLSESGGPSGYTASAWSCNGGNQTDDDTISLSAGDIVTCTVTNDDVAPELTVVKEVTNDDGGTAAANDFPLYVNDSPVTNGATNEVVANTPYTVSEDLLEGYVQTGLECVDDETEDTVAHPVTLNEGQSVTCTISNDDAPASITVIKSVVPTDAADPDDFDLTITPEGGAPIATLSGEAQALAANTTYTVGETLPEGFVQLDLSCEDEQGPVDHPVDLALGQDVTCTITNAESPTVTVIKATDPESTDSFAFTLQPGNTQQVAGDGGSYTWSGLIPGDYELTEDTPVDWLLESVVCDLESDALATGAAFSLDWGDHITCVFTNGELGSITVVKETDVDTTEVFDISIASDQVNGTVQLGDGDSNTWSGLLPGAYTVDEVVAGLQWDISLSCVGGDAVVGDEVVTQAGKSRAAVIDLQFGDHVTCTFVNEAANADLSVIKSDDVDPVTLSEDDPVGKVTYTISVTNLGPATAEDVIVTDTLPATMTFVSATAEVGTCSQSGGVVTCSIGDLAVGDKVDIEVTVETEAFGEVTNFDPVNVVEVSSSSPDPNLSNNRDAEPTAIIEVLDVVVLPFTGMYGDIWFFLAIALMATGAALLLFSSRRRQDLDRPAYPG